MSKVFNPYSQAGSQNENEPRLIGSIVDEMLHGNSPPAIGYRQYIASQENVAEDYGVAKELIKALKGLVEL